MPQELLDVVEVGVALDHFACAASAEGVRCDGYIKTKLPTVIMYPGTDAVLSQRLAVGVEEYGVGPAAFEHERPHTQADRGR